MKILLLILDFIFYSIIYFSMKLGLESIGITGLLNWIIIIVSIITYDLINYYLEIRWENEQRNIF
jgi:hypothetical protein